MKGDLIAALTGATLGHNLNTPPKTSGVYSCKETPRDSAQLDE